MLYRELEPIEVVEAAERLSSRPGLAFLDSAMRHADLGRYSYIGIDPFGTFAVRQSKAYWNDKPLNEPPLVALRKLLRSYECRRIEGLPPFQAGCIGYFTYEFALALEGRAAPGSDSPAFDEVVLSFYDLVLAFDHARGRCWAFSSGWPQSEPDRREKRAKERLEALADWMQASHDPLQTRNENDVPVAWESNFSREAYGAAIERVRDYIRSGDIYQANIAQCFTAPLAPEFRSWSFYRRLRLCNPAPFAAYLAYADVAIASSSPERFLRLQDAQVETRPIKGTAARSSEIAADERLAAELLNSEKDRAENIMIVDLLRNDLSRVCALGSVDVPVLCGLESYASVHHLVSVVTGRLRTDADGLDLLAASFPGGSITGAPKLRAMEIIREIEGRHRGVYSGSIGYLGFDGNMDLNIAIRTVTLRRDSAEFHVGGGITFPSDPAAEYDETLVKADKIFDAFGPSCSTAIPR